MLTSGVVSIPLFEVSWTEGDGIGVALMKMVDEKEMSVVEALSSTVLVI